MKNKTLCGKCKKEFDISTQPIKRQGLRKRIKCPYCGQNYDILTFIHDKKYAKLRSGQIINRERQGKRMSKKERLKLRRNKKNEMASLSKV